MSHYTLTLNPSELGAASRAIGRLETGLGAGDEGGKLKRLSGNKGSWTGRAATACFGEMTRLADAMILASGKAGAAGEAIDAFKRVADTAIQTTLPDLNRRWDSANTAYESAASKARSTYSVAVSDIRLLPEDERTAARTSAQRTRDQAISSAAGSHFRAQERLDSEFQGLVGELQRAATALGAGLRSAMPIAFSDAEWAAVRGGSIPPGMRTALATKALGDQSFAHRAAARDYGKAIADELAADAGRDDLPVPVSAEVLAALQGMGDDPDFVEALMTSLGPGGAALLSWRVRATFENPYDKDSQARGKALFDALTTVYGTASKVIVDSPGGGTRALLDEEWLKHFNPNEASGLGERWRFALSMNGQSAFATGYRPDLLLPFLQREGALSEEFSRLIADQAMKDYEAYSKDPMKDLRWSLYRGNDSLDPMRLLAYVEGDASNPFRMDLLHVALDRAGDYASSSNAVFLAHRNALMGLMSGSDELYNSEGVHDWLGGSLGTLLTQATIGYQQTSPGLADAALFAVADYLAKHAGGHLLSPVQIALGTVITDPRMMNGALMSVTNPFGDNQAGLSGVHTNWADPSAGPFMATSLWAALHQEAMLQPKTAAAVIAAFGTFIDGQSKQAQHMGYLYNPATGIFDLPNTGITSVQLFQAEAARHFLGTNLQADLDGLQKALEAELAQLGKDKEQAKQILGQLVDWARDPKLIVSDVTDKLVDFAIDKAVDWTFPTTKDIEAQYEARIQSLSSSLDSPIVKPSVWTDINMIATQLVVDLGTDRGPTTVVTAGGADGHPTPTSHNGDPTAYVGHVSIYVPGDPAHPITDDFLARDSAGKATGVLNISQMNPYQRQAYLNWLLDPAVQNFLGTRIDALKVAAGLAAGR